MEDRTMQAAYTVANLMDFRLSNLKLQKLLYFAHMYHLGRTGEPLIDGSFEAWDLGPVEPDVYHLLKAYGADCIRDVFPGMPFDKTSEEYETIDETIGALGQKSASYLVDLTHNADGAWVKNYKPDTYGMIIPNEDIAEEYKVRKQRINEG